MRAIILAGGRGTRLYPYTTVLPKPLMPVNEKPVLEIIINRLKKYNFNNITIATGYLAELIESYFGNGEKFGVKINYSRERTPLGTAGPLSLIKNTDNDFLVINGDILTSLNFSRLIDFHLSPPRGIATIAVHRKKLKINLGVLEFDKGNLLTDYIEKPTKEYCVSTGIYVFNKRISKFIPRNCYLDFPRLINILISKNEKIKPFFFREKWLDIGNPDDYRLANKKSSPFCIK